MSAMRASIVIVAMLAGVVLVQAAGGIKGLQRGDSRQAAIKGPRAPAGYQPPPAPQPPAPVQQEIIQPPPRPILPAPVKGPGQVTPVFNAIRVQQPIVQQIAQPAPLPVQQPIQIIQQQQQQEEAPQQEQEPEPSAGQQQVKQLAQQQQPQQQEADQEPPTAAQDPSAAIATPAGTASAEEANPAPEPYAFNYAFNAGDSVSAGSSAREEQQDASGRVTGFYTLKGEDGRDRRVDYVADANGFRATISTNEMGTAPKDSADVDWNAQAPSDAQLRTADIATQAARQRAALEPAQPISQNPIASGSSQQQQQERLAQASGQNPNKVSSPRQNGFAPVGVKQPAAINNNNNNNVQQQLQEPFEQIRQVELNARARKSRHAPFYLFTV